MSEINPDCICIYILNVTVIILVAFFLCKEILKDDMAKPGSKKEKLNRTW